tara:strand:+ start:852 stop:1820 length:969 start_codon:yes stop_codon:yes gene_type:complete
MNIVLIHVLFIPNEQDINLGLQIALKLRDSIFDGSTIYFVFISGFLFHRLNQKLNIKVFYKKKLANIVVPYVVISTIFFTALYFTGEMRLLSFNDLPYLLISGKVQFHLWYIPFIVLIFIISPVFLKINSKTYTYLLPLLLVIPMSGTRTGVDNTPWQFMFFVPIFLVGMISSMYYLKTIQVTKKFSLLMIILVLISTVLLYFLDFDGRIMNVISPRTGLIYVQKIIISFLLISYIPNVRNKKLLFFEKMANYSFAIYFTHIFLHGVLLRFFFKPFLYTIDSSMFSLLSVFTYGLMLLIINLILIWIAKKILGKYSRYIIAT